MSVSCHYYNLEREGMSVFLYIKFKQGDDNPRGDTSVATNHCTLRHIDTNTLIGGVLRSTPNSTPIPSTSSTSSTPLRQVFMTGVSFLPHTHGGFSFLTCLGKVLSCVHVAHCNGHCSAGCHAWVSFFRCPCEGDRCVGGVGR